MRMGVSEWEIGNSWEVLTIAANMLYSLQVCIPYVLHRDGEILARGAKEKLFWAPKNFPALQKLTMYVCEDMVNCRRNRIIRAIGTMA